MGGAKKVIIIAGPNGAGKTTFAREFLPGEAGLPIFVNADLIAAGLSPFSPDLAEIRAGRIMLKEIDSHAGAGRGSRRRWPVTRICVDSTSGARTATSSS